MEESREFSVALRLEDGFRFKVDFDQPGVPSLMMDEPVPLGAGEGPNAVRALAAAVGNCLGASLLFCLQRSRVEVDALSVAVNGTIERNEKGRLRVASLQVKLHPDVAEEHLEKLQRCIGLFEDFCIVTQSVRQGLEVDVSVETAKESVK
jgi:uncharacterized OsmC-like protein